MSSPVDPVQSLPLIVEESQTVANTYLVRTQPYVGSITDNYVSYIYYDRNDTQTININDLYYIHTLDLDYGVHVGMALSDLNERIRAVRNYIREEGGMINNDEGN